ncbi:hypothetical protein PITCH_A1290002 [uncultured Desulfobacterium sp.]|uniref:Uncharacterized protein n=1 Tax=uncultured Desulfobacterium sp. TaxID=201089 RepID=A0A445MSA1_9BACT|nr:hypothetical protein PITCH_A1290002 [uncultured Desulfobacterium sp.]
MADLEFGFFTKGIRSLRYALVAVLFVLASTYICVTPSVTRADEPGWKMVTAEPVSPQEARQILENNRSAPDTLMSRAETDEMSTMGAGVAASATEATPEIQELARALQHDPKLIYDYVRNNIDYVPTYGLVNGATATLLAGRGNDWDQTSLFIALMRASGYTANYVQGDVEYPFFYIANWLGVDSNINIVEFMLASGGIPVTIDYFGYGHVTITRVWAEASINGQDYVFDPAFKQYDYQAGISNLAGAMGYGQANLLASAGGTFDSNSVKNMSETNIRTQLQTYSANLVNHIRSNYPNAELGEIIGGRKIRYEEMAGYYTSPPYALTISNQSYLTEQQLDDNCLKITIDHKGINQIFRSWEIADKRITIFYTGSSHAPQLKVDGTLIATGSATTAGNIYPLNVTVNHPYPGNGGTYCDQSGTFNLKSGSSYNISCDFNTVSEKLINVRNTVLTENRNSGQAEQSDAVLGEALNIMGLTWLHEWALSDKVASELADATSIRHHSIGVTAQESGYYIDVKISVSSPISDHGDSAGGLVLFRSITALGSAFEHGMLEQMQGIDKPGASTIKLLQLSNMNGKKLFYGDFINWTSVKSLLKNYTTAKLTELQNLVNAGHQLYLPEDANIVLESWKGLGYIDLYNYGESNSIGMIIEGKYNGGYGAYQVPVDIPTVNFQAENFLRDDSIQANIRTPASLEPVNLATGAYMSDNNDLAMGGAAPRGLNFARSYNSSSNYQNRTMGYGCAHNYDIYLETHSHGDPVLGVRRAVDAASAIVGLFVVLDIMKDHNDLQGWLSTCLVSKWTIDQVIDNSVSVHLGSKVMEYIKLTDGTYNAPPGVTTELIKTGSTFSLKERFGTTLDFDSSNRISQWKDADGNTMSFSYGGDGLSSVEDSFGRILSLSYAGGLIATVSDSAGRMVSYGYDANDNLTTCTDPEGKVWHYGYDDKHRMTSLTNPLDITTATNTYNSLGRVDTQTVHRKIGGNITNVTYNFYFSGFRNIEEDPDGNQTVYFFDDKGRTIGVQDALGNRGSMSYDGQDHVIVSTDPRGNSTTFTYDGDNNLIKTVGPRTGTEYDTEYDYDGLFRKTDTHFSLNGTRQSHLSHVDYDAKHHPTGSTIYPEAGKQITANAAYYSNGLLKNSIDGMDVLTTMDYDTYGNPETTQTASEPLVHYSYNRVGRMLELTDQAGAKTRFSYDDRGLITTKTDPLGKTTNYT